MHTYIHTYIHKYIHTYTHTHVTCVLMYSCRLFIIQNYTCTYKSAKIVKDGIVISHCCDMKTKNSDFPKFRTATPDFRTRRYACMHVCMLVAYVCMYVCM